MNANWIAILVAAFGAFLQELLFWYEAKTRLHYKKYKSLLQSPGYWIVTVLMIVGSGIGSWLWFLPVLQNARTYLLLGAAFPIIFKKVAAAFVPKASRLGSDLEGSASVLDYLNIA
jgi:hypothetical protein